MRQIWLRLWFSAFILEMLSSSVGAFRLGRALQSRRTVAGSGSSCLRALSSAGSDVIREYLICPPNLDADIQGSVSALRALRPQIQVVQGGSGGAVSGVMWSAHSRHLQMDCTSLEEMYLGRQKLNVDETARHWNNVISHRSSVLGMQQAASPLNLNVNLGDGGSLQKELNNAIVAVHRASFMSRSLQKTFISVGKDDRSPVTIADFAVQALIIDLLKQAFPGDKFIAEEDSSAIKRDLAVRSAVIDALSAATQSPWSEQRLYDTVDLGGFSQRASRVWVLDPVDGTKGFMRGQHYCIALALLVDGKPQLSVMGCPNVNLRRVLEPEATADMGGNVADIDPSFMISAAGSAGSAGAADGDIPVPAHSVSTGSIFYAVSGRGAWARTLAMPLGGGYEVSVSSCAIPSKATLCESMEATHGDRDVTQGVFRRLGLANDFLRLDGQCKYCVVGAGAAEGNMRLPPRGYREKIWDHAPGAHFITEAGGKVTDLEGRQLNFGEGRFLSEDVQGILATNTRLHSDILTAIRAERLLKPPGRIERVFLD